MSDVSSPSDGGLNRRRETVIISGWTVSRRLMRADYHRDQVEGGYFWVEGLQLVRVTSNGWKVVRNMAQFDDQMSDNGINRDWKDAAGLQKNSADMPVVDKDDTSIRLQRWLGIDGEFLFKGNIADTYAPRLHVPPTSPESMFDGKKFAIGTGLMVVSVALPFLTGIDDILK